MAFGFVARRSTGLSSRTAKRPAIARIMVGEVRMHRIIMSAWLIAAVASAFAQVPASELAKPPANARHFVIQSTGGKHGDSWSWVTPDGTRMGRESMNLRGQVFELDSSAKAGTDGMPSTLAIRGVTPQGDASETFSVNGGTAGWKSPIDAGTAP